MKAPFVIETHAYGSFGHNPVVVADGTSFLVVDFAETDGTFAITAQRVARTTSPARWRFGRLALAWHEFNGSQLETIAELTSDLHPIGAPFSAALPLASEVVVASDAMFITSFNSFPNQARVDVVRNGVVSATINLPVIGRVATGSASWNGSELVTAWTEDVDGGSLLRLARISATGNLRSVTTRDRQHVDHFRYLLNHST